MNALSQRDSKWASKFLGFTNNTTIGGYGCTITALAMLAGTTPDIVNDRLKTVGGFAQGNLVIWSKVHDALPNLELIERGNVYDNDKVKANLPCLVEVDGAKIGGTRHWVVYIGNQRILDPWYGNENATNYYQPAYGYALFKINGSYAQESTTVQVPKKDFEGMVTKSTQWDVVSDYLKIERLDSKGAEKAIEIVKKIQSDYENCQKDLVQSSDTIKSLEEQLKQKLQLPSPADKDPIKLQQTHDIIWGRGFWWIKINRLKQFLPK